MKSPAWFTRPPTWLIIAVLAALMVINFVLSSDKATALIWDAVFLVALLAGTIRRAKRSRRQ